MRFCDIYYTISLRAYLRFRNMNNPFKETCFSVWNLHNIIFNLFLLLYTRIVKYSKIL